jgi:hypothetical protein
MAQRNKRTAGIVIDGSNGVTSDGSSNSDSGIESAIELDGNNNQPTSDDSESERATVGNGAEFIEPAAAAASASCDGTDAPRRRGRKPGQRNKPRAVSATQATNDLSGMLFTAHLFAAQMLKMELLAIDEDEAKRLGAAITRVTQLYDVSILPEKQMAFIQLAMVAGQVYVPRVMSVMAKPKPRATVTPINAQPQTIDLSGIMTGAD